MTRWRRPEKVRRRILRVLLVWIGCQGVLAAAGWLAASRLDEGDDDSGTIRRVRAVGGFELRPTNPALSAVRLDLAMAGAELDLTGLGRPASGVDLDVNLVMGGVGITVPADWRVWSSFVGAGGLGADDGVRRAASAADADLRIRAKALFGGVGVENAG
jgi:hypothetical protein